MYNDNYSNDIFNNYLTLGHSYAMTNKNLNKLYEIYDKNILKHLPSNKDEKILEIGSGMGHFLGYLIKNKYNNFTGVEIGKESYEYCFKNVTENIRLIEDLESYLHQNTNSFSAIIMNNVIEHLHKKDIISILAGINTSLIKSGNLIVITPNLANPFSLALFHGDFTHEVGFTEKSMAEVLKAGGFTSYKILPINRPIKTPWRLSREIGKSLFTNLLKIGFWLNYSNKHKVLTRNLIAVAYKE